MADFRYLKKRRQGWYFQIAVPTALRQAVGKATVTVSLKTRDLTIAQERRWSELVKAKEAFARLAGGKAAPAETLPPETLLEIDEYARATYHATLERMDAEARKGAGAWDAAELEHTCREACISFIHDHDLRPVAEPLTAYCTQYEVEIGSPHYGTVGDALLSARLCALEGRKLALEGKTSNVPETFLYRRPVDPVTLRPLRSADTRGSGLIFMEIAERCLAEKQRDIAVRLTKQTEEQYRVAHRLFDQFARQPTLDAVNRRLASQFLDAIAGLSPRWGRGKGVKSLTFAEIIERFGNHNSGLANRTLNKYVTALGIVWDYASKRDGYNCPNPWEGQLRPTTARRGNSETGKRGFTPEEIKKLLARPPDPTPAVHNMGAALPWLAWIGAYSGMRLNEITGLDVEDVKPSDDAWYFDLTQAKSEAGVRVVPVHSRLIDAGFIDYVAHVGKGPLWPGLRPGGLDGKRGVYASKRFTVYRRSLKLIDVDQACGRDRLDFHSLRRSAITALKHASIPEHEVAEIVGHDHPRMTYGGYADRQRLERLKSVIEAIRY